MDLIFFALWYYYLLFSNPQFSMLLSFLFRSHSFRILSPRRVSNNDGNAASRRARPPIKAFLRGSTAHGQQLNPREATLIIFFVQEYRPKIFKKSAVKQKFKQVKRGPVAHLFGSARSHCTLRKALSPTLPPIPSRRRWACVEYISQKNIISLTIFQI